MPRSNILVFVVDGLRASALGAYGNTTFPTPGLDRFASESLLLDSCYAPSAELTDIYRALWQSLHPARPASVACPSLAAILGEAEYESTIVTDDPQVVALPDTAQFHQCVQVAARPLNSESNVRANDSSQTELARFVAELGEVVAQPKSQAQFVWAHARGMHGLWDAPLDLQLSLLDDDDPPPIESPLPPDLVLRTADDSEQSFRYSCAYGAQVMVLDECWQGLMDIVDSRSGDEPWLVMLLGARGFPLGEHRRIGGTDEHLHGDQLHVPWVVRLPDGRGRLARSSALTSSLDVAPTLLDWIGHDSLARACVCDGLSALRLISSAEASWRDQLLSASRDDCFALRTPNWCFRSGTRSAEEPAEPELYVRPDDRWEANDVAKLCSDVVEELQAAASESLRRLKSGGC
jgi:arylsulfatase A-like enzyme